MQLGFGAARLARHTGKVAEKNRCHVGRADSQQGKLAWIAQTDPRRYLAHMLKETCG
jgi:hypothetical protein